jgi:hypothetical protein
MIQTVKKVRPITIVKHITMSKLEITSPPEVKREPFEDKSAISKSSKNPSKAKEIES